MGNGLCVETSSSWTVFDWLDKVVGTMGNYAGGGGMGGGKSRSDDEFLDRLSHHYTTMLLVIFTVIVSTKQYAGDPIQCWCPAQFTDAHVDYTNQICWIKNTYYVPMDNVIPTNADHRKKAELTYYQWVPMILLFMALMFKIPRMIWKVLSKSTSISLDGVASLVYQLQLAPKTERDEKLNEITDYFETWLKTASHYKKGVCFDLRQCVSKYTCLVFGRRYGNFFMTAAMFVKVLYFCNAIVQYFALNAFLGTDFVSWGWEIIFGLADDNPDSIRMPPRFPRVTLCDFQIRQMQNVQRWTVQCVLPINLFNSKIFLFIWFWIMFLCICSLLSLILSFYAIMFPIKRIEFIKKFLKLRKVINSKKESERRILKHFVMNYLKFDGVFVLRVMARKGTDILTGQIIENLFLNYKRRNFAESKQVNGADFEHV